MADVFISYKRTERARVEKIAGLLKADGLSIWFDKYLEGGKDFDDEIECEVTSAFCVLACWTPEGVRSDYVMKEAARGRARKTLLPVFLEHCDLPEDFKTVHALDLKHWSGDVSDSRWQLVASTVKSRVERAQADLPNLIRHAEATYQQIDDKLYPGLLAQLAPRIAALGDSDLEKYQTDIHTLLAWMTGIAKKEQTAAADEYELSDSMPGRGIAWMMPWNPAIAHGRATQVRELRTAVAALDASLASLLAVLTQPAP